MRSFGTNNKHLRFTVWHNQTTDLNHWQLPLVSADFPLSSDEGEEDCVIHWDHHIAFPLMPMRELMNYKYLMQSARRKQNLERGYKACLVVKICSGELLFPLFVDFNVVDVVDGSSTE